MPVDEYGAVVKAVVVFADPFGGGVFDAHRVVGEFFFQRVFVGFDACFLWVGFVAVGAEFDECRGFLELPDAQFVRGDREAVYRPELKGFRRFGVVLEFRLALQERQDVVAAKVVVADLFVGESEGFDDFDAQRAV